MRVDDHGFLDVDRHGAADIADIQNMKSDTSWRQLVRWHVYAEQLASVEHCHLFKADPASWDHFYDNKLGRLSIYDRAGRRISR